MMIASVTNKVSTFSFDNILFSFGVVREICEHLVLADICNKRIIPRDSFVIVSSWKSSSAVHDFSCVIARH